MASALSGCSLDVVFPNGKTRRFGDGSGPRAVLRIHDDAFFRRVLLGGEVGVGEAYVEGLWSSDDLVGLLELGVIVRRQVQFNASWFSHAARLKDLRLHRSRNNERDQARHNIHEHYDIGNAFFQLWLDETMTYSCAYFEREDEPLADAQRNKMRLLCEKLDLQRSDHLLEVGSGWGGFAMYAAEHYGCGVTSITISEEQLALARKRVVEAGLEDLVDIQFRDYRDVAGAYDKIVSVEMFEAVGAEYFRTFFEACERVLKPGGRLALQTISIPDRAFANVRDGVNWVQKYIFPGGMLPSIAEIERALHATELQIDGLEDIGAHYAPTLRRWREAFLGVRPSVHAMGFDERFVRMWEYYLAVCEAGFTTRNTGDLQIVFSKPAARTVPRFASESAAQGQVPAAFAR
jgi:cyclopropane-fatty-acyl-phospholipid synthase